MPGVRKKPQPNGKYHAWFTDCRGKLKFFTGTTNKSETLRMARRFEDEHRQVRLGYRPPPKAYQKLAVKDIGEVMKEYIDWGSIQGGRNGMPWGKVHLRNKVSQITWWIKKLNLEMMSDLDGILPQVEKLLRALSDQGLTPKTRLNYSETLKSFCKWCWRRDYIRDDPLKLLILNRVPPTVIRRAMTIDEIQQLLNVAPFYRQVLYETAMSTGLRANELKSLTINHLDEKNLGLILDPEWTKNRKSGFQPLSQSLVNKLIDFFKDKTAEKLYKKFYQRHDSKCKAPDNPLLFVSTKLSRELDNDLLKAGIPKHTDKGKIDFHALRVVYVTYIFEVGANVKEAQTLARHSTPDLTMNVYARTRDSRLSELAEKVSNKLNSTENFAISLQKRAVNETPNQPILFKQPHLRLVK